MLKGVPLSQHIYADPGLRDVGDIDLLIEPGMEETADRVLLAAGFHRNDPIARLHRAAAAPGADMARTTPIAPMTRMILKSISTGGSFAIPICLATRWQILLQLRASQCISARRS